MGQRAARDRCRQALAACLGGYLYGSLPFVDRLARRRHVDLAASGSGNVGGSNLWAATGAASGVLGWLLDASKGLAPIAACRRLGYDEDLAALAGVCGVAGQCWPIFLHFQGGRGISAFVGAGFLIDRRSWALSLIPMIAGGLWRVAPLLGRRPREAGRRMRASRSASVPLGCFLGIVTFPLACSMRVRAEEPATAVAWQSTGRLRSQRRHVGSNYAGIYLRSDQLDVHDHRRTTADEEGVEPTAVGVVPAMRYPRLRSRPATRRLAHAVAGTASQAPPANQPHARHNPLLPVLLATLLLCRRLTAPLPDDAEHGPRRRPRALAFRLLFDRNTSR